MSNIPLTQQHECCQFLDNIKDFAKSNTVLCLTTLGIPLLFYAVVQIAKGFFQWISKQFCGHEVSSREAEGIGLSTLENTPEKSKETIPLKKESNPDSIQNEKTQAQADGSGLSSLENTSEKSEKTIPLMEDTSPDSIQNQKADGSGLSPLENISEKSQETIPLMEDTSPDSIQNQKAGGIGLSTLENTSDKSEKTIPLMDKTDPVAMLMDHYNISFEHAQSALDHLNVISCAPEINGKLKFSSKGSIVTFNPINVVEQFCGLNHLGYKPNLSGIIENVVVIETNKQLNSFIEFLKIISPSSGARLKECYDKYVTYKNYLKEEKGLSDDLIDALGLVSNCLAYRFAYGDHHSTEKLLNRAFILGKAKQILDSAPYLEFVKYFPNFEEGYLQIISKYKEIFGCSNPKGIISNSVKAPLLAALSGCITYAWCINDEAPYYFLTYFPVGIHLVKLEDDERDEEYWNENFIHLPITY